MFIMSENKDTFCHAEKQAEKAKVSHLFLQIFTKTFTTFTKIFTLAETILSSS